jgi:hypothetical protein
MVPGGAAPASPFDRFPHLALAVPAADLHPLGSLLASLLANGHRTLPAHPDSPPRT